MSKSFFDSRDGAFRILEIVLEGRARQFLATISRHAADLLVYVGNAPRGINRDEPIDGGFDQAAIVRLGFAQLLLQLFLLRDVAGGRENALQLAARVAKRRCVIGDDGGASVFGLGGQFIVRNPPLAEH